MSIIDVPELIALLRDTQNDTWNVEAKEASHQIPESIDETLCAFANMPDGGTLILGVAENGGAFDVTGVWDPKAAQSAIASKARERITPPLQLGAVEVTIVEGKPVVAAIVPPQPSEHRPFRVGKFGKAYIRSGDGDYDLSPQEELFLVGERQQPHADRTPVEGATVQHDLVDDLLQQYLSAKKRDSRRLRDLDERTLHIRTNVIDPDTGFVTTAALYAFGEQPQQFLPNLVVKARAINPQVDTAQRLTDRREFTGPVPDLLDSAREWVSAQLRVGVTFRDGNGIDVPELPPIAIREIIANALVHRDLSAASYGMYTQLIKQPTKLIVESPGGLWGITKNQLGYTSPRARNAILYSMCAALTTDNGYRVIEAQATGIPAARAALAEAFLPAPHFDDQITKFTAILTSSSLLSDTDLRWLGQLPGSDTLSVAQKHALIAMRHGEEITNSSYRSAFPMDSVNARAELQQLVKYGLADAAGSGRGTTYRAPSDNDEALIETVASGAAQAAAASADDHAKRSTYLSAAEKDKRILAALRAAQHGLTRKELERETGLTRGQINPRIAKLSEKEMIRKTPSKSDSRSQIYSIGPREF
ncbi:divergent AAA domain protein [Corynebacterium sp. CMW7794]|uniref:RNA-binding domain-containing protein n=1 Tax=Corynebacterium sp. CMW7794 TaxID=1603887 RepID=UPI000794DBF3|nr:RNA-binding domain-containing protein [Corynebacterium sp. CMW7794]KXI19401.1 divergent AAA domain protein [Corynebacterium sp. CMW7794]